MKNIVKSEWLKDNMNAPSLVILDCRFDLNNSVVGKKEYEKAHIPNAYYLDLEKDLSGVKGDHGGRHPMPTIESFKNKLESLGISNDTTVVIYDGGDIAVASRLWWMLKYIGMNRVYILEGGFENWKKLKFEETTIVPSSKTKGQLVINVHNEMLCDMNSVKNNINNKNTIIIDSRARERYLGDAEPMDKRAGHIPNAVNYFWQENFNGNEMKSLEELRERFKELADYDNIIIHCGSGVTACPNILAMDEVGIKPKLYLGGWSDWVSYEDNPVS